jgi:TrmH RNA methyltransferase
MKITKVYPRGVLVYGKTSCTAVFSHRPQDILQVYLIKGLIHRFSALLKWCAEHNIAYHLRETTDLEKITQSVHHEGICLRVKPQKEFALESLLEDLISTPVPQCLLFLDSVDNPHNVGAILRTCSHFGVKYVLVESQKPIQLPPSTLRISMGATEQVQVIRTDYLPHAFDRLRKLGYKFVAADPRGKHSLFSSVLPSKCVLMMGSETLGLSKHAKEQASALVRIPGTDQVESLNVASATAIFLAEYWRQNRRQMLSKK